MIFFAAFRSSVGRKIEQEFGVAFLAKRAYTRILIDGEALTFVRGPDRRGRKVIAKGNMRFLIDRVSVQKRDGWGQSIQNCRLRTKLHFFRRGWEMWKIYHSWSRNKNFLRSIWVGWMIFRTPLGIFFSFNNPFGACKNLWRICNVLRNRSDLVIRTRNYSVYGSALKLLGEANLPVRLDPLYKKGNEVWLSDHPLSMSSAKRRKPYFGLEKIF